MVYSGPCPAQLPTPCAGQAMSVQVNMAVGVALHCHDEGTSEYNGQWQKMREAFPVGLTS